MLTTDQDDAILNVNRSNGHHPTAKLNFLVEIKRRLCSCSTIKDTSRDIPTYAAVCYF